MMQGFIVFAVLAATGFSVASELFYDPAANDPDCSVEQDGMRWLKRDFSVGESVVNIAPWRMLPEFETADVSMTVILPKGADLVDAELETVSRPGLHPPDAVGGYSVVARDVPSARSGRVILSFSLDVRTMCPKGPAFPSRIHRIGLKIRSSASGSVLFGPISIVRKGLFLDFSAGGGRLPVYDLDSPESQGPQFVVRNEGPEGNVSFAWKMSDAEGAKLAADAFQGALQSGESRTVRLPRLSKAGVAYVDYEISREGDGGFVHRRRISFAAIHAAGRYPRMFTDKFLFSVCAHMDMYPVDELETMADYLELAGCNHVRVNTDYWYAVNPEPGIWRTGRTIWLTDMLAKRNIERQTGVLIPPENQKDKAVKVGHGYPSDLGAWEKYCEEMARRLKGRVRMFEDINEPNLCWWTPELYSKYEYAARRGIKRGNPEALLVSGEWGGFTGDWMEKYYETYPDVCDIVACHYHGPFEHDAEAIERAAGLGRIARRPWFPNECAWSNPADRKPAEILFKKLIYSWVHGAIGYTWYNLRNKGWDPKNGEHNYGMLTQDLYPRESYVAFNALAGTYRDAAYSGKVKTKSDVYLFRFQSEHSALFPLWTVGQDYGQQCLLFSSDAKRVECVDLFGNVTKVGMRDGRFAVEAEIAPKTIRLFPSSARLSCLGPMVSCTRKLVVTDGSKSQYVFSVNGDCVGSERVVAVELKATRGIGIVDPCRKVRIVPGGTIEVVADITGEKGFSVESGKSRVTVSLAGIGSTDYLVQPVVVCTKENPACFVANRRDLYTSFVEGLPGQDKQYWTGPSDLSMQAFVFHPDSDSLFVRVCVDDDVHCQRNHGYEIFNGDSPQIMFSFPGQGIPWEIGVAWDGTNKTENFVWHAPAGVDRERAAREIESSACYSGKTLWYNVKIPLKTLRVSREMLMSGGLRFNVMQNDNDGPIREGFISLISGDPKDAENFPVVVFQEGR